MVWSENSIFTEKSGKFDGWKENEIDEMDQMILQRYEFRWETVFEVSRKDDIYVNNNNEDEEKLNVVWPTGEMWMESIENLRERWCVCSDQFMVRSS